MRTSPEMLVLSGSLGTPSTNIRIKDLEPRSFLLQNTACLLGFRIHVLSVLPPELVLVIA